MHPVPRPPLVVGQQGVAIRPAGSQRADHLADLRLAHRLDPFVAAFRRIAEHDLAMGEADVLPLQRGQAVGAVVLGVSVAAHPEEAEIEQAHRGREDPFPPQAASGQFARDGLTQLGQRGGEVEHVIVLLLVPLLPPARVVEVLPAPGGVEPDGLDVPVRPRADPHLLPGGGDYQVLDAREIAGGNWLVIRAEITKATSGADPPQARPGQVAAPQPGRRNTFAGQSRLPK